MASTARRARSEEAKGARIAAFLDAAREIAARDGVRHVTLTAVTAHVGLHPSALRRYFESTEELLLELTERGWGEWRDELLAQLSGAHGLDASAAASAVTTSLVRLPVFCDLLTHAALSLEGAVRLERARQYKRAATVAYEEMLDALTGSVERLEIEGARTVLTTAMGTGGFLYQLSRPTPTLRQLYAEEPRWAHSALRFNEQLTAVLTATVRGAQRPGTSG
ncbi:TetR family transcriptional regulator [Streptomyces sp. HNM0575]|uniref:TetR family transcriptional regulator n=1 Tax=Streptomyces sp. HNM0575 TaxID=2716338 RepID=UPI00145ED69A|nr:TetR family transcriptional regulator [Streptomyces sp. HNM0575]NLU75273.1 TetR family transcriptional regulator [Streptomyces sp. HNM0575]